MKYNLIMSSDNILRFRIRQDLKDQLLEICEKRGISQTNYLRSYITPLIKKDYDKLKKQEVKTSS